MRYIKEEILLRNRGLFIRARDEAFGAAEKLVDDIINAAARKKAFFSSPVYLKGRMEELVDRLFHARYFARMSAGGNTASPARSVNYGERAYVDHVEAMYSYSRSINRLFRHEMLMDSFVREHPDVSEGLRGYLNEIRASDVNLITANLKTMRERMTLFRRFMTRYGAAPGHQPRRRAKETSCRAE